MKRTVREFIEQRRPGTPWVLDSELTVEQACQFLVRSGDGAILVSKAGKVRGIFSERDLLRLYAEAGEGNMGHLRLGEVMSRSLVVGTPDYSLEQCLMVMTKMKVRHLPIVQEGTILHLLTLPQIAEVLIEDKDFMIHELIKYISGPQAPPPPRAAPESQPLESWN